MLRDKFKAKRQSPEVEKEEIKETPSIALDAEPVKQIPQRPKPNQNGKISFNYPLIAPEFARRRMENKEPAYKIFKSIYPESLNWNKRKVMQYAKKVTDSFEYKDAVGKLKKSKLAKAQEIVNKKLAWGLEESTKTLAFLINSTKEIIEEDLQVQFRISRNGREWVRDPDGNIIKKKRYLSDSAVKGLVEATKELNKIYGLTKGEAPTENRYTQINFLNSELKE